MSIEEQSLSYVLKQAQLAFQRRMDEALRPLGLTVSQYAALNALDRVPGSSNAALARMAFVTAQSMHGLVEALASKGLIVRSPAPDQGRAIATHLTEPGRALLAQGRKAVASIEARVDATIAPLDVSDILAFLRRYRDALG